MKIRYSTPLDSGKLIQLTTLTPMKGLISLCTERKPDFFQLLEQRGEYFVLVAEDEENNILGSISATRQIFMINNTPQIIYYLGDLKVHPACKMTNVAYRLLKFMHKELLCQGADLIFCTVAAGNHAVKRLFEGRTGMPSFKQTSVFHVVQLLPKSAKKLDIYPYGDAASLLDFYNKYYFNYSLYPNLNLTKTDIHLVEEENGKLKAAITLSDPFPYKQNIVTDYSNNMAVFLTVLKALRILLHLPAIPSKGNALKILYLKYYGYEKYRESLFVTLLRKARHYARENGYHLVSIAVDENNSGLIKLLRPLRFVTFFSNGFVTSLKNNDSLVDRICRGIKYEDYSLV